MANPRYVAVSILFKIEKEKAYSNLAVSKFLKETDLNNMDKALVSALVYGVLDRKITLDFVLSKFMKTPLKKTAPFTLFVLRTALYQIMFMDKVPQSAAVNEAVKLIRSSKENRNAGFVNAVLRNIIRSENLLPEGDTPEELSVRFSCPEWIVNSFLSDYGAERTKEILKASLEAPPFTIRVNTVKTDTEVLKTELEDSGITCKAGRNENSLIIEKGLDISACNAYKKGLFHVQDEASQKAVSILAPKPGERLLDICAAPGGKSFTAAYLMENKGEIIACDIYEQRTGLISASAKRLGLSVIDTRVADAQNFNPQLGKFDCIICDVPCSGLGVIRRKPDIKYKPECDFKELEDIQYKIFSNAVRYLKPGGRILYSTCTLRRAENENLVIRVQKEYNVLNKVYEHTFMPHIDKTDGFYCALFEYSKDN